MHYVLYVTSLEIRRKRTTSAKKTKQSSSTARHLADSTAYRG